MKIALVAGEASGDLLGGLLLDGLRKRWPHAQFVGIGGEKMLQRGMQNWWPCEKLAVRGYIEVLRHYREIVAIRKALRERLLAQKPDIFIGIDAPDFNLDLERDLKAQGIKTVHFISPSIWAWRAERIEKIRAAVDHVLCIFPFEKPIYDAAKISASYVGHPLAQVIPMQPNRALARQRLGLPLGAKVIAILPGSRADEIKYLAGRFFKAISLVCNEEHAGSAPEFIVPCVPNLHQKIQEIAQKCGVLHQIRLLKGQSHEALAACDVALVASGTATLEAALFKRPMVIAYNMNALSWQLMWRKKLQAWVGLPNILCKEFVVPEYLQDAAQPANLAVELQNWLKSPEKIAALEKRFIALHHELLRNTQELAVHAIEDILQIQTSTPAQRAA